MRDPIDLSMIGPGWRPIVIELDEALRAIDPDYTVLQIKEKFGDLRFYMSTKTKYMVDMQALVWRAEGRASETCEECGEPGDKNDSGWILTLCDPCRALREEQRKEFML